jgi:hypothetical protein
MIVTLDWGPVYALDMAYIQMAEPTKSYGTDQQPAISKR